MKVCSDSNKLKRVLIKSKFSCLQKPMDALKKPCMITVCYLVFCLNFIGSTSRGLLMSSLLSPLHGAQISNMKKAHASNFFVRNLLVSLKQESVILLNLNFLLNSLLRFFLSL